MVSVLDFFQGHCTNIFEIQNLYYYLDITTLICLINTNKYYYKKRSIIYSIIIGIIYPLLTKEYFQYSIYKSTYYNFYVKILFPSKGDKTRQQLIYILHQNKYIYDKINHLLNKPPQAIYI